MSRYERQDKSARKHPHTPSSGSSKTPAPPPRHQPGWKGPGYVKPRPSHPFQKSSSSSSDTSTIQEDIIPIPLQQRLLDIYKTAFPICQEWDVLKPILQEVKGALFERDFERAFGSERSREAYAVRWSPGRTVGYANLLAWVCREWEDEMWIAGLNRRAKAENEVNDRTSGRPSRVVCFGGGAAEVVAFAGLLRYEAPEDAAGVPEAVMVAGTDGEGQADEERQDDILALVTQPTTQPLLDLQLVDTADWASVINTLNTGSTIAPILSKYASASAKATNASLLRPEAMSTTFTEADCLALTSEEIKSLIGPEPALVTLLFTLNELYTTSIPSTTAFLLKLTIAAPTGSLLLVADSPGSYSQTAIKKSVNAATEDTASGSATSAMAAEPEEPKKYPMHWLMEHTLLEKGRKKTRGEDASAGAMWEKIVGEESRWFRLEENLRYPVSLENMRMQVHLYRRL